MPGSSGYLPVVRTLTPAVDSADAGAGRLPLRPVGPISALVVDLLTDRRSPEDLSAVPDVADPLTDGDFQLALWLLYELHYRDLPGVPAEREWDPVLLGLRGELEARFEHALRLLVEQDGPEVDDTADETTDDTAGTCGTGDAVEASRAVTDALRRMTASPDPGRLARHLAREATREEYVDYLAQRAVYHLRESDPQSFVLPRVGGAAKTALAELQYDEYGAGRPERLHAEIYARGLSDLGMATDVLSYVAGAEPTVLCTVNTMSLFCLHRRLRGAALGHLAYFEATSSLPCRFVAIGAHRLELPAPVADYYEEHVEADAVHEQVAVDDICGTLVAAEPHLADDVLFGARACRAVDEITADALFARWERLRDDAVEVAS